NLLGGEAAELAATEQAPVLLATVLAFGELAAFSFTAATGGGSGHGLSPQAAAGCAGAAPSAGLSAAGPSVTLRDFSSFIIGEGPDSASRLLTVRWRSTASLNLNACSSSASVSLDTSMFIST